MPDAHQTITISGAEDVRWQLDEVSSPLLGHPVPVITARNLPYVENANRYQNLTIYLPRTAETSTLVGTKVATLPGLDVPSATPRYHVHIHGGAWRDPRLTSESIEPTVAHMFASADPSAPISAVASINYTVSQFPTHPTLPYDAIRNNHTDPAREAVHPQHVADVLRGFALLRSFGLTDQSYILSGHSCGACLAFQALLQPPRHFGLDYLAEAPCPAALVGLNGLYDLPELATGDGLGESHRHLRDDYEMFLSNAFGPVKTLWSAASPARVDPTDIAKRVAAGKTPRLVMLDQSTEDQLVPMNQRERLAANLSRVRGLRLVEGHRLTGKHAAPWQRGDMIWATLQDVFALLQPAEAEAKLDDPKALAPTYRVAPR